LSLIGKDAWADTKEEGQQVCVQCGGKEGHKPDHSRCTGPEGLRRLQCDIQHGKQTSSISQYQVSVRFLFCLNVLSIITFQNTHTNTHTHTHTHTHERQREREREAHTHTHTHTLTHTHAHTYTYVYVYIYI